MKENLLKFDLHLHTWYSDGKFSPKELLKKCKGLGLEVVAITDHESVKGVSEALAVGKKLGIKVIPGIELVGEWERIEYHILGYFIDYQSKKLENFIDKWRKAKEIQIKNMVKKLQDFGPRISFEEVLSQTKDYLAPSHILDAVFSFPDNLFLLQKKFGIKTQDGKTQEGRAYVERKKPNIKEVLDLITVNSYKRLVSGHEAPVYVCWAQINRAALIRIPQLIPGRTKSIRVEFRCPDPSCNPYLAFTVMLAAGLDGIKKKIELPEPVEENVYQFDNQKLKELSMAVLPGSLKEALEVLKKDKVLKNALGPYASQKFLEAKQKEWKEYRSQRLKKSQRKIT